MRTRHPDVLIPEFKELVLPRSLRAEKDNNEWLIELSTIPEADFFAGRYTPLFVNSRGRSLVEEYGVTHVTFHPAKVVERLSGRLAEEGRGRKGDIHGCFWE